MGKLLSTPKEIIINSICSTLEKNNIEKLMLSFNIIDGQYSVYMSSHNVKSKLDLAEKDVNVIKKIFINKIERAYKETSDNEVKNIIIEILVPDKGFKVFVENPSGQVEQFKHFTL